MSDATLAAASEEKPRGFWQTAKKVAFIALAVVLAAFGGLGVVFGIMGLPN